MVKQVHEPGADALLDRLFALTILMGDAMDHDLAARGLSRARATVIAILSRGGAMTQRELADALRVTPRNVTGLVDALERDGLAARGPHPRDRRATLVTLTEAGSVAARALDESRRQLAAFLFDRLPAGEVEGFGATLERLIERLGDPAFAEMRAGALESWRA